jgi:GH18 family chitinase/outer membrane protein assembly factor BamB
MPSETPVSRRGFLATVTALAATTPPRRTGIATAETTGNDGNESLVIGYSSANTINQVETIPFEKVTDVIYHSIEPRRTENNAAQDGGDETVIDIQFGDTDESVLQTVRSEAAGEDVRAHVSLFHENISEEAFSEIVSEYGEELAEAAAAVVSNNDLDGLNIDWEPQTTEPGWTRDKARDYLDFLTSCRSYLDELGGRGRYQLTIAATDGLAGQLQRLRDTERTTSEGPEITEIPEILDYIYLMTYDYHGEWSNPCCGTGFNAPLHAPCDSQVPNESSVADSMVIWSDDLGLPTDMLVTGLPFYGRSYGLTQNCPEDEEQCPEHDTNCPDPDEEREETGLGEIFDAGAVSGLPYERIWQRYISYSGAGYEGYWHPAAKVPWMYSTAEDRFVTYENPESIGHKVDYTLDNGFAGVMIWELADDSDGKLLDAVDEHRGNRPADEDQSRDTGWPMVGGGPARTGVRDTLTPTVFPPRKKTRWPVELDESVSSPAVVDGVVYVESATNKMYALDAKTGESIGGNWPVATSDTVTSPVVVNGTVYTASWDGKIYAWNAKSGVPATGDWPVRAANLDDPVYGPSSPTVVNNTVYLGSVGEPYMWTAETGEFLRGPETPPIVDPFPSRTAVAGGIVCLATVFQYGSVHAWDASPENPREGSEKWSVELDDTIGWRSPIVANNTVYVGTGDGTVYAWNTETGDQRDGEWPVSITDTGPTNYLSVRDGTLYAGGYDGNLYALDANTGSQIHEGQWPVSIGEHAATIPTIVGDTIYVGGLHGDETVDDRIYALDAITGEKRGHDWPVPVGHLYASEPAVAEGSVYVGTYNGTLHAFDAETGRPR